MQDGVSMSGTTYSLLEMARLPFAVLNGTRMMVYYASEAFCTLVEKSNEEILGNPCTKDLRSNICVR